VNKGNVWGSIIMNVEKGTTPPPAETFYLTTEASEPLLTEAGDNILYD